MDAQMDDEQIGRFIYSAHRVGSQLTLLMTRMGKAPVATAPAEPMRLACTAREADAMFARLSASDEAKAEFSALKEGLAVVDGQLERAACLDAAELRASAAVIAASLAALPRFGALVDGLRA